MLEIKNLYKNFGKTEVLRDVSLSLKKGEVLSILGNSGSGKSTLLRILVGLEKPTSFTHFHCTTKTAMMFQNYALFPHLNVEDNILFALQHSPKTQRNARLQELLRFFGIETIRHKRIDEISGGQAQRVAFARAIAMECELLLLDEPFSNLDSHLKESLRGDLKEMIKKQGLSAIIVTHDIDDAYYLSDKIALLKQGSVIDCNTPQSLYFHPKSKESQAFLPHLNVIDEPLDSDDLFFKWIIQRNYIFSAGEIRVGHTFRGKVLEHKFLGAFCKVKVQYKHIVFFMLTHPHQCLQEYIDFEIIS
ncbi:iron ABC transporter ATP-binding protein [Helicobacter enhydrae]|uniref:Iron ABC transporter ATP-binding protein n=1 Tax=Helicobacter enhydrae TaxID=222136 RepID=A0A1B1U500_9HELI|nr:ABC transporter ATP-binding protein [Helicobacter enhydrae]ANV97830.1 iron ABC transporter ATP-binding protein [Helicobacter enhydrae]